MAKFYWDLLTHSWQAFVGAFGNTTLGFIVPIIIVPLVGGLLVLIVTLWREGRLGVMSHLGKTFSLAVLVAIFGEILVYGSIFSYWVFQTEYSDHNFLENRNGVLTQANQSLLEKDSHWPDTKNLHDEIDRLNIQINGYKNALSPAVRVFPISHHDQRPGVPKMEYFLTTGAIRTPVDLTANCDTPIADGDLTPMTTSGGVNFSLAKNQLSSNRYKFSLESPAWSPSEPLYVTIIFVSPVTRMPNCSFTEE